MDRFALLVPKLLPRQECYLPDSPASCKGCGVALAVRQTYKALGCEAIKRGTWKIPWQPGYTQEGKPAGEPLLPACLRIPKSRETTLSLCFDNEACLASAGPGTGFWEKRVPSDTDEAGYAATACPSYPFDLMEKIKKAYTAPGNAYIHILCPCPVGWDFAPDLSVKLGKLAVESNLFPLYEAVNQKCFITIAIPQPRSVADYLRVQGRFKNLTDKEIQELAAKVTHNISRLVSGEK